MSELALSLSPLDKFIDQIQSWPHWLAPSPHVAEPVVIQTAKDLLRRMQAQLPVPEWDRLPRPEVVGLTPDEAMQRATFVAPHWRDGLARIADLALWRARQEGLEAEARAAFQKVHDLVRRQVWQAAVSRWVGAWRYDPRRRKWQQALVLDHSGAAPAVLVAEQAAFHHAVHAMWLVAYGEAQPFPLAPLVRLWQWGYWPLGIPLGILGNRFVVAAVTNP